MRSARLFGSLVLSATTVMVGVATSGCGGSDDTTPAGTAGAGGSETGGASGKGGGAGTGGGAGKSGAAGTGGAAGSGVSGGAGAGGVSGGAGTGGAAGSAGTGGASGGAGTGGVSGGAGMGGVSGGAGTGGASGASGSGGSAGTGGSGGGAPVPSVWGPDFGTYYSRTCALDGVGAIWCWGDNSAGQVGIGAKSPFEATPKSAGGDYAALAVGPLVTCGVKKTGALFCWGATGGGELGLGATTEALVPTQVGSDNDWVAVSGGDGWSCALKATGTLWCWGKPTAGSWPDASKDVKTAPFQVGADSDWKTIGMGRSVACMRKTDDSVWCFGNNFLGAVGDGTPADAPLPKKVTLPGPATQLGVGYGHVCAVVGGVMQCWGNNINGQIGPFGGMQSSSPVAVGASAGWAFAGPGQNSTCSVSTTGGLSCFGSQANGLLGDGVNGMGSTNVPIPVGSANDWESTHQGSGHGCARKKSGEIWCWGSNTVGQLGRGTTSMTPELPAKVGM